MTLRTSNASRHGKQNVGKHEYNLKFRLLPWLTLFWLAVNWFLNGRTNRMKRVFFGNLYVICYLKLIQDLDMKGQGKKRQTQLQTAFKLDLE